jgi:hypothetical protein
LELLDLRIHGENLLFEVLEPLFHGVRLHFEHIYTQVLRAWGMPELWKIKFIN